jgi:hypothetical protein
MHGRHIQRPRHVTSPAVGHLRRDAFRVNRGGA